jgi:hypothetical protein
MLKAKIVMTTYNRAEYFRHTISSLRKSNCESDITVFDAIKACDSRYVVITQDDVDFSRNWYERGVLAADEFFDDTEGKFAYVGLFNRIFREGSTTKRYVKINDGHPGLVTWIINRHFWNEYKKVYKLDDYMEDILGDTTEAMYKKRNFIDYKLSLRCQKLGYAIGVTTASLVQHIGCQSSLHNRDMSNIKCENYKND